VKTRRFLLPLLSIALLSASLKSGASNPVSYIEAHCSDCHDQKTQKGGLNLAGVDFQLGDPRNFAVWQKIFARVSAGEMPPKKRARPPEEDTRENLAEIYKRLAAADRSRIEETGRLRMRRMTRSEFENTLTDLLALPRLDIKSLLPPDGSLSGFDKMADGLDLSPAHLSAYAEAVERALDLAIATRSTPPPSFTRRIYPAGLFKFRGNLQQGQFVLLKDKQPDPAYPPRGGFEEVKGYIASKEAQADMPDRKDLFERNGIAKSQSAVGLLNPNLAGYEAAMNVSPIYAGNYRMKASVWGFHWNAGQIERGSDQAAVLRAHEEGKQQEGGRLLALFTAPSLESNVHEFTAWLGAHESIVFDPVSLHWLGLRVGQVGGRAAKFVGPGVALDWFEIEGPINTVWPPESHRRLFGNLTIAPLPEDTDMISPRRDPIRGIGGYIPSVQADLPPAERKPPLETVQSRRPIDDASRLLTEFTGKAFRRPVSAKEVSPYVLLVEKRLQAKDCFEDAMRRAFVAILTSPEFLFHSGDFGAPLDRDDNSFKRYQLASRLSYWLWNGPPDAQLLAKAANGTLHQPDVLHSEVDRLLNDARSERFIRDFCDQWLELRRANETSPDPKLYPEYHFLLHEGMVDETRMFIRELIHKNLPITSLLRPEFAMLSQRLAEHYGINSVRGVGVRRVPVLSTSLRGGLLGQAAIHKLTANGTTTSPVKRGVWVMDRLLDSPPPPPPPSAGAIDPDTRGSTTVREQLQKHRSNEGCATCHSKIDPAGFALESFDPIGGLRARYRSTDKGEIPPEQGQTLWKTNYRVGPAVDPSGEMPDGKTFSDLNGLTAYLAEQPQRLARAFVAHLSRYATGTEVGFIDREDIGKIIESTAPSDFGLRSLLHAFAESALFQAPSKSSQ
jgi:hypothetical protein